MGSDSRLRWHGAWLWSVRRLEPAGWHDSVGGQRAAYRGCAMGHECRGLVAWAVCSHGGSHTPGGCGRTRHDLQSRGHGPAPAIRVGAPQWHGLPAHARSWTLTAYPSGERAPDEPAVPQSEHSIGAAVVEERVEHARHRRLGRLRIRRTLAMAARISSVWARCRFTAAPSWVSRRAAVRDRSPDHDRSRTRAPAAWAPPGRWVRPGGVCLWQLAAYRAAPAR